MTPSAKPIRISSGAIAVGAILAAVVLLVMCIVTRPFIWVLFGFELISLFAGVFTLCLAIRAKGDAMALACTGGTIFVAAVLGHVGTKPPVVGAMPLMPWTVAQTLMAAALGAIAALLVLQSNARAWKRLIGGMLLGLPVAALIGALAIGGVRASLISVAEGLPSLVQTLGVVVLFLVFTALLAASVHLSIVAFADAQKST